MIIYKYLNKKGGVETIRNNSVLLNTPSKYNDPFDSETAITDEENNKSFDLFLNYQLFKGMYDFLIKHDAKSLKFKSLAKLYKEQLLESVNSIKESKKYVAQWYLELARPLIYKYLNKTESTLKSEFKQAIKNAFKKIKKKIVVSCFGSTRDSILMWSHYAEMHKGVCIEYEINDKDFKKMHYEDKMPSFRLYETFQIYFGHDFLGKEIDFANDEYAFVYEPLLTKSLDWEYEGEIRCVYSAKKLNPKIKRIGKKWKKKLVLKMPDIKSIYIGCNASDAFVKKIKSISGDTPVYRMKKKDDEYGLMPEKS